MGGGTEREKRKLRQHLIHGRLQVGDSNEEEVVLQKIEERRHQQQQTFHDLPHPQGMSEVIPRRGRRGGDLALLIIEYVKLLHQSTKFSSAVFKINGHKFTHAELYALLVLPEQEWRATLY